jgi:hypothetical protein
MYKTAKFVPNTMVRVFLEGRQIFKFDDFPKQNK